MSIDSFLVYYFLFLSVFALIGIKFYPKKVETKQKKKSFSKFCPCVKMVESGWGIKFYAYSAIGGFLYSSISLSQMHLYKELFLILFLSLFCGYLSWVMKN